MQTRGVLLLGVAALAVVSVGFGVGFGVVALPAPVSLASPPAVGFVPVEARSFDDARPVDVDVTPATVTRVRSAAAGRVTRIEVETDAEVQSGQAVLSIDGRPLVALASGVPPWRDLVAGDRGEDVDALQAELVRLGHLAAASGSVDAATLAAVGKSRGASSVQASVDRDGWLWLPQQSMRVEAVAVTVGDDVSVGDVLLSLAGRESRAQVAVADGAIAGGRVLVLDGQRLPVGADGVLAPAETAQLLASNAFRMSQQQAPDAPVVTLRMPWALAEPVTVFGVPPSALTGSEGARCVFEAGVAVPVQLVASQLGLSLVTSGQALKRVDVAPPGDAACG